MQDPESVLGAIGGAGNNDATGGGCGLTGGPVPRRARRRRPGGDGRLRRRLHRRRVHAGHLPAEQLPHLRQVARDAILLPGQLVDLALRGGAVALGVGLGRSPPRWRPRRRSGPGWPGTTRRQRRAARGRGAAAARSGGPLAGHLSGPGGDRLAPPEGAQRRGTSVGHRGIWRVADSARDDVLAAIASAVQAADRDRRSWSRRRSPRPTAGRAWPVLRIGWLPASSRSRPS